MTSHASRAEYTRRMHRALAYIDAHIDEPLDLITLAHIANFSAFHFHRLFSAWLGETFGDYLRRRRLELAAMKLAAQPRCSVLNVALSVGFGSAEAFTRAFKARFGCSPSLWREKQRSLRAAKRKGDQTKSKPDQALDADLGEDVFTHKLGVTDTMKVSLIDRAATHIAYLRHLGPYGEPVARFWQEVYIPWAIMNKLGPDHARYGISHDDPSVTAPEQCRYDACAEVAEDFLVTADAFKSRIPGGKYAVLRFTGSVTQIGEAWSALLRDWLPASGLQLDKHPCFEYYRKGASYDSETGDFECDICIPVMPL